MRQTLIAVAVVATLALGVLAIRAARRGDGAQTEPAGRPGAARAGLATDDRIAYLLAACARNEAFLADTSNPIPVLVSKLEHGQLDPLRQAKAELAEIGDPAVPELRRLFDARFSEPHASPVLQNVLAVVGLMRTDGGRDILLRGLEHAQDSVRTAAARALAQHARPEDYERLAALLPIASRELEYEIGQALFASDRPRLEEDFARWFAERRYLHLLGTVARQVCDSVNPASIESFRAIYPQTEGEVRVYLEAAAARAGDPEARAELTGWLEQGDAARRTLVVRALERVGLTAEIARVLREDPDEGTRAIAAGAIASAPPAAATESWLLAGISDPARSVRLTCLDALVARGVPSAEDEVLEMLKGDRPDLEDALRILRGAWEKKPELAERGLDILERLLRGEIAPRRVEERALERGIAQVPLERAVRFLYERAVSTPGMIQGLPAHRWYLTQAGNTGSVGWSFLRERWKEEKDPERRVDIVMACAYDRGDAAREFLSAVVESERSTPFEVLYAAELLVHKGPAGRVAPLVKRVTLRIEDPLVRPALHCLLWRWYGLGA